MDLERPDHLQLTVRAQIQEVMFIDGSVVILRPVYQHGESCMYHRATQLANGLMMIFDLRHIVRQIGEDICSAPPRDMPGIVFYTLRQHFKTANALLQRVAECGVVLRQEAQEAA